MRVSVGRLPHLALVALAALVCLKKPIEIDAAGVRAARRDVSQANVKVVRDSATLTLGDQAETADEDQTMELAAMGTGATLADEAATTADASASTDEGYGGIAPAVLSLRADALRERAVGNQEREALAAQEQALEAMQEEQLRLATKQALLASEEAHVEAQEREVVDVAKTVALQLRGLRASRAQHFNVWAAASAIATADAVSVLPVVAPGVAALAWRSAAARGLSHVEDPELVAVERQADDALSMLTAHPGHANGTSVKLSVDEKGGSAGKFGSAAKSATVKLGVDEKSGAAPGSAAKSGSAGKSKQTTQKSTKKGMDPFADLFEDAPTMAEHAVGAAVYIVFGLLVAVLYSSCWKHGYPQNPALPAVPEGNWIYPVFNIVDCVRDWRICCAALFCGAARWADSVSNAKVSFMPFWPAVLMFLFLVGFSSLSFFITAVIMLLLQVSARQRIRQSFGIQSGTCGSVGMDCCLYTLCAPCAIVQEARQVEYAMQKS